MVDQPISDFLNDAFIVAAAKELDKHGFVSDEHDFAPFHETMNKHAQDIEAALRNAGHHFELAPGYVNHPHAYAYFLYCREKFRDLGAARDAVRKWLDKRYTDR